MQTKSSSENVSSQVIEDHFLSLCEGLDGCLPYFTVVDEILSGEFDIAEPAHACYKTSLAVYSHNVVSFGGTGSVSDYI